jgi:hypothetical protein
MIHSPEYYNQQTLDNLENIFIDICQTESIEDIEYLLTSNNLKENVDINTCNGVGLELAAGFGNLEVIKFMLDSPKLKQHAIIENNDYEAIVNSIRYGYLDILKYFLNHPSLKQIDYENSLQMIIIAAESDELEIFTYLVDYFQENLPNMFLFNYENDIFFNLFIHQHVSFIEFLVTYREIPKNEHISKFLEEQSSTSTNPDISVQIQTVNSIFEKQALNKKLHQELLTNAPNNKKTKI